MPKIIFNGIEDLYAWMRQNNVRKARLGDWELELDRVAPPPVERKPLTPEDVAKVNRERKRRQYETELGHPITDEFLERLP